MHMFQQANLARNIRHYRKKRGLSQKQLADKLFVTAQNVSKWETGKSAPDLDNLCKLAEILEVSTDSLLGNGAGVVRERLLIAIDGGGTKTEFVLYTESGRVLRRLVLGGCNPNAVGMETTQAVLQTGVEQLITDSIAAIYAGIAGCGVKENEKKLLKFLKRNYPGVTCTVASDVPNVIYSAPVEARCIAVVCGTGSAVYAKTPETMHRIGGWGYLWESWCSGYNFGRDALGAALAARDGLAPRTRIREFVEERLGGDIWEKIGKIYQLRQEEIAAFAEVVFEAYSCGDLVAEQILQKNICQLAVWINTAAAHYDCGKDVVLAGGLTARKEILERFLQPELKNGLRLIFNEKPQICGAAVGGIRLLGAENNAQWKEVFYQSYNDFLQEAGLC